jgi:hypothetical protein
LATFVYAARILILDGQVEISKLESAANAAPRATSPGSTPTKSAPSKTPATTKTPTD